MQRLPVIAAVAVAVVCGGCFGPPPGKGRKAETGFHAAAPIIAALDKYHTQQGHYPAKLTQLVPRYISDPSDLQLSRERYPVFNDLVRGFSYSRQGDAFTLGFRYSGPGMNDCVYDSRSKKWDSSGYY